MPGYKKFPNLFVRRVSKRHIALFHPFRFRLVYLPARKKNLFRNSLLIKKTRNILITNLIKQKFFVPRLFDYNKFILKKQSEYSKNKKSIASAYFMLSARCNLSCQYCRYLKIFKQISSSGHYMSPQRGVDAVFCLFKQIPVDEPGLLRVVFYGGEPFLNFNTLKIVTKLLRLLESKGRLGKKRLDIGVVTNGTLITEDIAYFLKAAKVNVSVSLDGFADLHNRARTGKNRKDSFKDALYGYRLIKEICGSAAISLTVGSHNIELLPDIALYFAEELKPSGVVFNIMRNSYFEKNPYSISMAKINNIFRAYEILRKYGIHETTIDSYVDAIQRETVRDFCWASGRQFAFFPNGDIKPCHSFFPTKKYKIGNTYMSSEEKLAGNAMFKLWASRNSLFIAKCKNCPAILICGGGCVHEIESKGSSFWDIDKENCLFTKKFLEWYVKDRYRGDIKKCRQL